MKVTGIIFLLVAGFLLPTTEGIFCYNCVDCGAGQGTLVDCSRFSNSSSCYFTKTFSTDEISKSCGTANLDLFGFPEGCTTEGDIVLCRCTQDRCNVNELATSSASNATTSHLTTTSAMRISTAALSTTTIRAPSQTSTPTPSTRGITCYICRDCGPSVGVIFDCASAFQSTSCYLAKEPSGEITRSCGTTELDEIGVAYGCQSSTSGYTICRCDTDNCNEYPDIVSGKTTTPATSTRPTTQPSSSWMCYTCSNCRSSIGNLVECSSFTNSRTCLLMLAPSGEVSRQCGTEAIDELNLLDGCSLRSGTTICKCSENACNEYPQFRTDETTRTATTRPTTTRPTTIRPTTTRLPTTRSPTTRPIAIRPSTTRPTTTRPTTTRPPTTRPPTTRPNTTRLTTTRPTTTRPTTTRLNTTRLTTTRPTTTRPTTTKPNTTRPTTTRSATTRPTTTRSATTRPTTTRPNTTRSTTTRPATTRTSSVSRFHCFVCLNCGNSVGRLVSCPSSSSCTLITEQGQHSRLCGNFAVEALIPEDNGCRLQGDTEICKCSTSECNTYYIKTGINSIL